MRKKLTAILLAALAFGLIAASAASLGGINSSDLGADASVVAACDTDGVTSPTRTVMCRVPRGTSTLPQLWSRTSMLPATPTPSMFRLVMARLSW